MGSQVLKEEDEGDDGDRDSNTGVAFILPYHDSYDGSRSISSSDCRL